MRRLLPLLAAIAVFFASLSPGLASAQPDPEEVRAIVVERAQAHGVNPTEMVVVASCESGLDPNAVGDSGHSIGLYQLYDRGLLPEFYAEGYTNPFSAWQSADFAAEQFAYGNAGAWSCYWLRWRGESPPWW